MSPQKIVVDLFMHGVALTKFWPKKDMNTDLHFKKKNVTMHNVFLSDTPCITNINLLKYKDVNITVINIRSNEFLVILALRSLRYLHWLINTS